MEWLNLHSSVLDSPEVVGSDTRERGVWLSLLRYCIGQENGGRIEAAKPWKDRQWQQLARVTLREVTAGSRLYWWEGETLCVWGYPIEKESEVRRRRDIARANGKTGGRPKVAGIQTTNTNPNVDTNPKPTLVISEKAEGEWKGNGKEMEGECSAPDSIYREMQRTLPDRLRSSPAFVNAWEQWVPYRSSKSRSSSGVVPPQTWDAHLRTCLQHPTPESAAEALMQAMAGEYPAPLGPKKSLEGGAGGLDFDPHKPHAHTGGLEVFNP